MGFELSDRDKRAICENSLERVLNTAERVCEAMRDGRRSARLVEDAGIAAEDIAELKQIARLLWDRERDRIFRGED